MGLTEKISVFSNRAIAKNASITLATPLSMQTYGPIDKFKMDISASGGGNVSLFYRGCDISDGVFFMPGSASNIGIQKSSVGAASRDLYDFTPLLMPWMNFKAKELNASPVVLTANLIVSKQ
jgi:hypothetical protein